MDEIDYLSGREPDNLYEGQELLTDGGIEEAPDFKTDNSTVYAIVGGVTTGAGAGIYTSGSKAVVGTASGEVIGASIAAIGLGCLAHASYESINDYLASED
jgi:hypothetical protein